MRYLRTIVIALALILSSACIDNLECPVPDVGNADAITVIGRTTRFDDYDVDTRSAKTAEESRITSYAMAIFPVGNNGVGNCVYYEVKSGSQLLFNLDRINGPYEYDKEYAIYIFANMPLLTSDEYEGVGKSLAEMLDKTLDLTPSKLNIPVDGFPMIGSLGDYFSTDIDNDGNHFIMSPKPVMENDKQIYPAPLVGTDPEKMQNISTLQIPMKALFAKMNFEIEVSPDQIIEGGFVPQFQLKSCELVNVPKYVDFKKNVITVDSEYNAGEWQSSLSVAEASGVASGANKIKFSFYLPENLLTPAVNASDYEYPFGKGTDIRDEDQKYRQRYKVKLLDYPEDSENKNLHYQATNIVLNGEFKDHQSHTVEVTYTIHLGKDNYGNFDITRNGEYNNYITIRGILNSDDTGSGHNNNNYISIDHRVNVRHNDPVIIALRREVLLDSHFEVRPLRIKKNDQLYETMGASNLPTHVKVSVDANTNWMRLERSFGTGMEENIYSRVNSKDQSIYITEKGSSYGKRKYFTHNLITGANAGQYDYPLNNSTEVIIPLGSVDGEVDKCVWIYVDEVTPTQDNIGDGVRTGNITISYWKDTNNDGKISDEEGYNNDDYPSITYAINQRKLFDVQYGNRPYYIEYFEEYLHNFDADDEFGHTQYYGMEWGLDGINLSYDHDALFFNVGDTGLGWLDNFLDEFLKALQGESPAYYDYYIKAHDDNLIPNTHKRKVLHEYAGYDFCNEIIDVVNGVGNHDTDPSNNIEKLALNQTPKSAVEYCYNKNKRYEDGLVVKQNETDPLNLNWYLPSTDEIEAIVMSTYDDENGNPNNTYGRFLDFQGQYYWSSQPAYIPNYAHDVITFIFSGRYYGDFYYDDYGQTLFDKNNDTGRYGIGSARATKVTVENNQFKPTPSGTSGYYSYYDAEDENRDGDPYVFSGQSRDGKPIGSINRDDGNRARNAMSRVRCVRKQAN